LNNGDTFGEDWALQSWSYEDAVRANRRLARARASYHHPAAQWMAHDDSGLMDGGDGWLTVDGLMEPLLICKVFGRYVVPCCTQSSKKHVLGMKLPHSNRCLARAGTIAATKRLCYLLNFGKGYTYLYIIDSFFYVVHG
jgi:hypothetical protein